MAWFFDTACELLKNLIYKPNEITKNIPIAILLFYLLPG